MRVRPDLLTKSDAIVLKEHGVIAIELDALTFVGTALGHWATLPSFTSRVYAQGIEGDGVQVGTLSPAYRTPDTTIASKMHVKWPLGRHARIHPVLVYADAALRGAHMDGTYQPLGIGEAVCCSMMDIRKRGVSVIRAGQ